VSTGRACRLARTGRLASWAYRCRGALSDMFAMVIAAADVATSVDPTSATFTLSLATSMIAVLALVLRRHLPFLTTLMAIPGFLLGWSELGPMIALGTLAWKRGRNWRTTVCSIGIWCSRFVIWPPDKFIAEGWREHVSDGIYGCFVVVMPIAIGLLITARQDLSKRIAELAASREREARLQAIAIRADERAKIAREMHDVVSHQVSLIAIQAGALQVTTDSTQSREAATLIRSLATRTLDELRKLVGGLRTATDGADEPDLETLLDLVRESSVEVTLDLDLDLDGRRPPPPVASAAYRTVQESLTNVRKHASDAPTTVRLAVESGALHVVVRNAPPATNGKPVENVLPSGGHGLIGLRERAALLGGTFVAGRTETGGFEVNASFPLPPE
jgi:signal transduction histidine kinase